MTSPRRAHSDDPWPYRRKFAWSRVCTCCGMPAEVEDRVMPFEDIAQLGLDHPATRRVLRDGLALVPCCRKCQRLTAGEAFDDIRAKRRGIQARYRERYRKDLLMQDWTAGELAEMSYALRVQVIKGLRARLRASMRCNWPMGRAEVDRLVRLFDRLGL